MTTIQASDYTPTNLGAALLLGEIELPACIRAGPEGFIVREETKMAFCLGMALAVAMIRPKL